MATITDRPVCSSKRRPRRRTSPAELVSSLGADSGAWSWFNMRKSFQPAAPGGTTIARSLPPGAIASTLLQGLDGRAHLTQSRVEPLVHGIVPSPVVRRGRRIWFEAVAFDLQRADRCFAVREYPGSDTSQ